MKITCPNCDTKFAIGLDNLGPKGRKLKCSSCTHVWREFDPKPQTENSTEKPTAKPETAKPEAAKTDPNEENDQSSIDDMFASTNMTENANEENDQSSIDDMFAATEPADSTEVANEENDQDSIDDMFAADGNEENDQNAIDDMFNTPPSADEDENEENDQNAIDDMFNTPAPADEDEENDQNAVDDMFNTPAPDDEDDPELVKEKTSEEEFKRALPSQSPVYKKPVVKSKKTTYIYWGGLAVAASLILGIFIIGKDMIIGYFPKSAATYQLYGFETNIIGLEFVNINVRHQSQDGIEFLLVNGSIMNSSNSTKTLPKVRGYLIDRAGKNIFNWPVDIAKTSLAAGEIVSFKSGMKDPAPQAQKVKFQFVIDKELAGK